MLVIAATLRYPHLDVLAASSGGGNHLGVMPNLSQGCHEHEKARVVGGLVCCKSLYQTGILVARGGIEPPTSAL